MNSTLKRLAASTAATALLTGGTAALAATASAATAKPATTATANTASAASSSPRCLNSQLHVSVADDGNDSPSVYNLHLYFKNISHSTCHLDGYPGVSAVGTHGNQLGDAATEDSTQPYRIIVMKPGYTAHSILHYDSPRANDPACDPAPANGFRIYPPGDYYAMYAPWPAGVCTKTGPQYEFLSVTRVKSAGNP